MKFFRYVNKAVFYKVTVKLFFLVPSFLYRNPLPDYKSTGDFSHRGLRLVFHIENPYLQATL